MSHELRRLAETAWSTPHLITQEALDPILSYLTARNNGEILFQVPIEKKELKKAPEKVGGIGEILIDGPLTYRPIKAECAPAGVSYTSILAEAREYLKMGVDTILLTHSSPGGEASHAFSTALELRQMCDEAGVQLISYVDTYAASASYLLACVADMVIMHPEAQVGSIGCIASIANNNKMLADAGVEKVYISSTPGKSGFDKTGAFSKEFIEKLQANVTNLGNKFAKHVETFTGVPFDDIIAMDAQMFNATEALENNLANAVMTHTELANWFAEKGKQNA